METNQIQEQIVQKDQVIKDLEAGQEMKEAEMAEYQGNLEEQYRAALAAEKALPPDELPSSPGAKPG